MDDLILDNNIETFLNNKGKELKIYYENGNPDIQKLFNNIYCACYRFGLNRVQTLYMLKEAIKPFEKEILFDLL